MCSRLKNVSKTFGEVAALHHVNFEVGANEIVGLLGDNGAGKSTLVKIITGYHQPDPGGEIYWKRQKIDHLSVAKARDLGIEVVYQERALGRPAILVAQYLYGPGAFQPLGHARHRHDEKRNPAS